MWGGGRTDSLAGCAGSCARHMLFATVAAAEEARRTPLLDDATVSVTVAPFVGAHPQTAATWGARCSTCNGWFPKSGVRLAVTTVGPILLCDLFILFFGRVNSTARAGIQTRGAYHVVFV